MNDPSDSARPKNAVPRSLRIGTFLLSVLLTFLLVWLLGFVLSDIGNIDGPDYQAVIEEHVDQALRDTAEDLQREIAAIETGTKRQTELQKDLKRSMDNARSTMQQMMDLQRLSLEQKATPTDEERNAMATAQQRFLDAQDSFEEANTEIADSNERRFQLRQELEANQKQIAKQEEPAREEFDKLSRAHQFKVASLKLAFIVPLFAISAWLFFRYRRSAYRSILVAALVATFWKVGVVMFDYFPRDFFKYIAIVAAIVTVLAFLVWLLRKAVKPNRELLLSRYREAYRSHNCPVCAYPIARGPLRFALWTRKGPKLTVGRGGGASPSGDGEDETPYACPACGTMLFETCGKCAKTRHTLLPFCEHCGDEQAEPDRSAATALTPAVAEANGTGDDH
jgi:predicted RNA-binding Zn-ribbon protein involved in translation (DUF1610 family)